MSELWVLLAICGLATYLWRGPGVLISAGIDPRGEAFTWISCVAYAIIVASAIVSMPLWDGWLR